MVFCFFLIAVVLVAAGFIYLQSEIAQIQKIKFGELQTIGKMKVDQILRWRKSRSDDSRRIADSPAVIKILGEWLRDPSQDTYEEDLVGRLQLEKELGIYSQAFLVDVNRKILLSASPKSVKPEVDCRAAIDEALVSDKPVFGPFHRVSSGEIHIDIATVIRDVANRPLAVLVLATNAHKFLFPIIEFWPTASPSGETLLARREGDQVLFLSRLKYREGMTLNLRFPLSTTRLPAAQAVLGRTGVFHGRDYSGKEVIADLRSVPGTDWYLVTKETKSEIWKEIYFHAITISIIIFMIILCIAGGMMFWYQHLWARERERTEKRVRESEVRYRSLFEAAKDGILILDAGTGMTVDVNPYLAEKLGYSREQFFGKKAWEIGFLKDVFANQENFLKLQREKYVRYDDLPLETANGRKIDVEFIGNVYQVDHHEVIQCNIRDITERKEAERKINGLERQYSRMVENAKDGILSIKTDGSFVFANPAFCSMLGYSLDELRRFNILDTYVEESREEREERMLRLERGETVRFERPMKRKDGSCIFVEIGAWKDQYGNLQAFVRDVTERKRAEQALRKSEERFRRFAAASGYGFAMGDLKGQMIFANAAALRLVEEDSLEVFLGKSYYDYYAPEGAARLKNEILPIVIERERWEGEIPLLTAKGKIVTTEQNIFLIRDEQGVPTMVGNIVTDITERKRMEKELAQARETQFRTLIETLPSKVFLKDRNSTFLACNKNYARDLKIRPEDVVGKTDFDFFPTLLAEKHRKDDARIMESGKIESWEEEYQVIGDYLEGSRVTWINTVRAPVRDRSGNVTGLFGFFWDITEQKKIETEKQKVLEMKAT